MDAATIHAIGRALDRIDGAIIQGNGAVALRLLCCLEKLTFTKVSFPPVCAFEQPFIVGRGEDTRCWPSTEQNPRCGSWRSSNQGPCICAPRFGCTFVTQRACVSPSRSWKRGACVSRLCLYSFLLHLLLVFPFPFLSWFLRTVPTAWRPSKSARKQSVIATLNMRSSKQQSEADYYYN